MSDVRSVTDLVARAKGGDKRAWDDLVERYAPLVWSICRRHQLSDADAADIHQSVSWRGDDDQMCGIETFPDGG
jgi:DNA-directed RNA polymerase specialized sigma24 family protein